MIIVLMGVSGSGKTTLGKKLAERLEFPFLEGDDFHSVANKTKMEAGIPLTDEDRLPWLQSLSQELKKIAAEGSRAVIACSALKKKYRDLLSQGASVQWIYLKGRKDLIRRRIERRQGHFMKAELLESQFDVLEEPGDAIVVDINLDSDKLVETILDQLKGT